MSKLTNKQAAFCLEYMKDFNGAQAAIRAGYSKKTAESQASRLLSKVKVQQKISELTEEALKRGDVEVDKWLRELKRLAFSDMRDIAEWNAKDVILKDSQEISDHAAACVKEVAETKDGVRVKLASKEKSLEMLGRYFGLLEHGAKEIDDKPLVPAINISIVIKPYIKAAKDNKAANE